SGINVLEETPRTVCRLTESLFIAAVRRQDVRRLPPSALPSPVRLPLSALPPLVLLCSASASKRRPLLLRRQGPLRCSRCRQAPHTPPFCRRRRLQHCSCSLPLLLSSLCGSVIMAASSSSSMVSQTEIGTVRPENVLVQVITLRLTKENYFSWSPAMTMEIDGRGRMAYIDGSNPGPARTSDVWHTWFLEDNQKTAWDMWVILEQMYGQKKTAIRTYQVMKTVYNLRQGNSSVAEYYATLKAKWEELDYHSDIPWHCPQDQALHIAQEWENRVLLFLAGLNDEFEGVESQILNFGEVSSIEDVYSVVEAEEQRRLVTNESKRDLGLFHERSALVSRGPRGLARPPRRCTHCKKTGHTVDYCWDLHPDKKGNRGRSSSGKTPVPEAPKSSGEKLYFG
ncbi:hypothetical protein EJ110_NYTH59159, partial [Nymphaea thermarum]